MAPRITKFARPHVSVTASARCGGYPCAQPKESSRPSREGTVTSSPGFPTIPPISWTNFRKSPNDSWVELNEWMITTAPRAKNRFASIKALAVLWNSWYRIVVSHSRSTSKRPQREAHRSRLPLVDSPCHSAIVGPNDSPTFPSTAIDSRPSAVLASTQRSVCDARAPPAKGTLC
jgi:hypothetical protein